jgi:hypothetical protein
MVGWLFDDSIRDALRRLCDDPHICRRSARRPDYRDRAISSAASPEAARKRARKNAPAGPRVGIPEVGAGTAVGGGEVGVALAVGVGVGVGVGVSVGVAPAPDTMTTPFMVVPPGTLWTRQ